MLNMYKNIIFNLFARYSHPLLEKKLRRIMYEVLLVIKDCEKLYPDFLQEFEAEFWDMSDYTKKIWEETKIIYEINDFLSKRLLVYDVSISPGELTVTLDVNEDDHTCYLAPDKLKETYENIKKLNKEPSHDEIGACLIVEKIEKESESKDPALLKVASPAEIEEELGLPEGTIRRDINRSINGTAKSNCFLPFEYRKSGKNILVLKDAAYRIYGKGRTK